MGEMGRFQRSWLLFRSSMTVIGRNKTLLVFPVVTFVMMVVIALFFLAPVALMPTGHGLTQAAHWEAVFHSIFTHTGTVTSGHGERIGLTPGAGAYLVFLYFVSMFWPDSRCL
jgi:hypothetical protein